MEEREEMLSAMDVDAIGEILNISMGSSATSASALLNQRVNITTPKVEVIKSSAFHFEALEPAVAVEINYVSGLDGKNIMILKQSDVKVIVGLLLQTDFSDQEFVLDEMSLGAICEVMNQMMGAASTALSQLLNRAINISPPNSFEIDNSEQFKSKYYNGDDMVVAITFNLMIGDLVNSEFISLMTVDLAKELISSFGFSGQPAQELPLPEPEPVPAPAPTSAPQSIPAPAPSAPPARPQPVPSEPIPQRQPEPVQNYKVQKASYQSFDEEESQLSGSQNNNLNMIMSVPLKITVEIGRTTKKIKEILDFTPGTIVDLDKQAGSQVDVFVNGKQIAKGDVVIVDDYYGVRITEVSSNSEIMELI
jgi:flagellar motor switch protein FliN/FliY